jgi:hypothetical protein
MRRVLACCAAAAALLVAWLAPAAWLDRFPSLCLFRNLTGWECPGCGMTRAILCLLRGDLAAALHYNRLALIVFPLLGYCLIREMTSHK